MKKRGNYDNKGRVCTKCNIYKPYTSFHKHKSCPNGYNTVCKKCRIKKSKKDWDNYSMERKIFSRAKSRAKKRNINFNIKVEDIIIPKICPVLGLKEFIPSIDRINSSKGYIKNNVRIISNRANMLKNNATIKELKLILKDLKEIKKKNKL